MMSTTRFSQFWYVCFLLLTPYSMDAAIVHESQTEQSYAPHAIMVSLPRVSQTLATEQQIDPRVPWMKVINDPIHPLRFDYSDLMKNMGLLGNLEGREFLDLLEPMAKYSYVLTGQHLVLAEIDRIKRKKSFSKHFFLSGFATSVRYAGEAWVDKYKSKRLIIDNNSGTYKPDKHQLNQVALMLSSFLNIEVLPKARTKK